MDAKILSFIVPAYNSEKYIDKCLSSFLCDDILGLIEVIVVNDGSNDSTARIAGEFVDKYPGSFVLINKENGGHGSAVNTAVRRAHGRYMRIVDSDDWVVTNNLPEYIKWLCVTSADVVISHFHTVNASTGKRQAITTSGVAYGVPYSLDQLMAADKGALSCCMLHGIAYKTSFYLGCGILLSEGLSYEDQEYSTIPLSRANSILFVDIFIYEYLIGTAEQSISSDNQVRRASQLEQVFWNIVRFYKMNTSLSKSAKKYILYKLAETLQNYYVTMLMRNKNRMEGRKESARMHSDSSRAIKELRTIIGGRYQLLRFLHVAHIDIKAIELLKELPFYAWIRRNIRKL